MVDLTSMWPSWGDSGSQPSDGVFYEPKDNPSAAEFNHLWYQLQQTFGLVEDEVTAINNSLDAIDSNGDGVVDKADYAADADASTYKGTDLDSDGDGIVDEADFASDADASTYKGNDIDPNADGVVAEADYAASAGEATDADYAAATTFSPFTLNDDMVSAGGTVVYDDTDENITEDALPSGVGDGGTHTVDYFQSSRPSNDQSFGQTWVEPLGLEEFWSAPNSFGSTAVTAQSIFVGASDGSEIGRVDDNGDDGASVEWTNASIHSDKVTDLALAEDPNNFVTYILSVGEADQLVASTVFEENEGGSFGNPGDNNWTHTDHSGNGTGIAAAGSFVVSVGGGGDAIAYDVIDGTQKWNVSPFSGSTINDVALTSNYAVVFSGGDVKALDRTDGSVIGSDTTSHDGGAVAIGANAEGSSRNTYSADDAGTVVKLDWTGTGDPTVEWSTSIGGVSTDYFGDVYTNASEDVVYVVYFYKERVYALDKDTGEIRWDASIISGQQSVASTPNSIQLSGNTLVGSSKSPTARQWIHDGSAWYRLRE